MALSNLAQILSLSPNVQMDMLMSAYFRDSQVGANLRRMMIGEQPIQPLTSPFDQAITGRLRSDSAAIRQHSRNVQEAAQIMGIASEAVDSIRDTLKQMQDLAQKIDEGELEYSTDVAEDYNEMREKIKSIISHTQYNTMHLLDSEKWGGSSLIDEDGKVQIKSLLGRDGVFNLKFYPLDDKGWNDLEGEKLEDEEEGDRQEQLDLLSELIGDVTTIEDMYSGRKSSLEFQASRLESQADIMDEAVEARKQTPEMSLEEILVNLLLRYSGRIFDQMT